MHVLLTGSAGFLGSACRELLKRHPDIEVSLLRSGHGPVLVEGSPSSLDAPPSLSADELARQLGPRRITHIMHVGALSSPESCERNPENAYTSNVRFTEMLAEYAQHVDAHLTTISTDLVFDGTKAPNGGLSEEDSPRPLSVYSQTKLSAERITLRTPSHTVVRVALLYGHSFSASLGVLGWMERAFKEGTPLTLFSDEYRTPIHVMDAAAAILDISARSRAGIWHCGGPARVSRVEFGTLIAQALGYDSSLIRPTSRLSLATGPARPEDVSLNSERLWKTLGWRPRGVAEVGR
jgi:dTDP-4-dehydrorhamnose reductase